MVNYDKLRGALAEKKITQGEIAERLGCTRQSVGNKLTGKTPLTVKDVTIISDMLDISLADRDAIFFA